MMQSSGEIRRENAGVYPVLLVIAREGGRSSTLRPIGSRADVSGILDRPVKPDDDSGIIGCLKIEFRAHSENAASTKPFGSSKNSRMAL